MSNQETTAQDPLVEEQIERTLQPYRGIATPAMLETIAENLRVMLTSHPVAVALLEQLRDHPAPAALATEDRRTEDKADDGKVGA
jgi:hypothetical protein